MQNGPSAFRLPSPLPHPELPTRYLSLRGIAGSLPKAEQFAGVRNSNREK